ncbi:MAG TPA: response regulator [Nitrososphaera sp.]|nr:response regulator [Nitrososphaera sp.]
MSLMPSAKRTVLICDDEADLLAIYAAALKKSYNILTASTGKECIEKYMAHTLRGKKVDVLLLDYRLGDSTGEDIACKIRDLDGGRTILMSAYDLESEKVDELKASNCIVDVITKPVSLRALTERVRRALD